jgi:hypothetical protein
VELTRAATEETMNIGTLLTRHARYRPHHVAVSPRHLDRTADRLHPEDLPTQ